MTYYPEWARFLAAAIIPPAAGTLIVFLGAKVFADYGWTLFILYPVILGFTASVVYAPMGDRNFARSVFAGLLSIVSIGIMIMASAIEGLICLLMSLPLGVPLLILGVSLGYLTSRRFSRPRSTLGLSALLLLCTPLLMGFENSHGSEPVVHKVTTSVEVDAPIEAVWNNVIVFPQITDEPKGILRLGFAYPISARIEGEGVGAVRYCEFDTGPFVEPITAWEAPYLLAFDVTAQPRPMTELSPYEHLHAAHLEFIRSQKGQFRLYERNGKTVVEGTTFYTHDIAPDIYWNLFSDAIIQRIHLRVLEHIKNVSESHHR